MYAKAKGEGAKSRAEKEAASLASNQSANESMEAKRKRRLKDEEIPEIVRLPEDIRDDARFEGQTTFMIKFVPMKCKDEMTPVDETCLREWIITGITEEDPYSKFFFIKLKEINERIDLIDRNIRTIPTLKFLNEDGQPKPEAQARQEREELFNRYGDDRVIAENELSVVKLNLQKHIEWRRQMVIEFVRRSIDRNTDTCTWLVRLSAVNDALELEDFLIEKENWPGIRLAMGNPYRSPPLRPWAGRSEVPDGSRDTIPDYRHLQVDMAGARIMRVPHGVGAFKQLDRASSTLASEQFNVYYGEYELGKRSGYGVEVSDTGVYCGSFNEGFRDGRGRLDLADGTTVVGVFGRTIEYPQPSSTLFQNPYLDGEPNGQVEINFSDGGFYRGQMRNGRITGTGDYMSALNEVYSGMFLDGTLHGERGYYKTVAGDEYLGDWVNGELHGKGHIRQPNGNVFEGTFDHSLRHGKGIARLGKLGRHCGYYVNGIKHGKGSLEYGTLKKFKPPTKQKSADKAADKATDKPRTNKTTDKPTDKPTTDKAEFHDISDFQRMYQGFFLGGSIANRGSVMDTRAQVPMIISRMAPFGTDQIKRLLRKEAAWLGRSSSVSERSSDIETHVRLELATKKIRIYNQQKHLTKKTMYIQDQYGDIDSTSQLNSQYFIRQERLKARTDQNHLFKKAVVPRLRRLNKEPVTHLADAYTRIRPEGKLPDRDRLDEKNLKMLISDFEEAQERQRFLKYDLIWQRAENAFNSTGKTGAQSLA